MQPCSAELEELASRIDVVHSQSTVRIKGPVSCLTSMMTSQERPSHNGSLKGGDEALWLVMMLQALNHSKLGFIRLSDKPSGCRLQERQRGRMAQSRRTSSWLKCHPLPLPSHRSPAAPVGGPAEACALGSPPSTHRVSLTAKPPESPTACQLITALALLQRGTMMVSPLTQWTPPIKREPTNSCLIHRLRRSWQDWPDERRKQIRMSVQALTGKPLSFGDSFAGLTLNQPSSMEQCLGNRCMPEEYLR